MILCDADRETSSLLFLKIVGHTFGRFIKLFYLYIITKTDKQMKAILIDVLNENVRMVEVDDKNVLKDWYKHIGCSMVEPVYINSHDSIMVDEEGGLTEDEDTKYFSFDGNIYIGNGLVVGVDRNGKSVDPCICVEEVRSRVEFPDVRYH